MENMKAEELWEDWENEIYWRTLPRRHFSE
jgi:hypothetical protein